MTIINQPTFEMGMGSRDDGNDKGAGSKLCLDPRYVFIPLISLILIILFVFSMLLQVYSNMQHGRRMMMG